jgi:general secretion pathway protein J
VSARPPARARGFTLLELTIALVLMALMGSVLVGSVRLAAKSWDTGEAKAEQVSSMRQTGEFLRAQLSAAFPQRLRKAVGMPLLFAGARDEVHYAAALPPRVAEGGVYYFRLAVDHDGDKPRLVLDRLIPDVTAMAEPAFTGADRSVLAVGVDEVKFGYYGRDAGAGYDQAPTWRDHWDDPNRLPSMMRIEVKPTNAAAWPPLVVELKRAPEAGCRAWDNNRSRCAGAG